MAGKITYGVDFKVNTQGLKTVKSALQDLQKLNFSDIMKINGSTVQQARTALNSIKQDADKVQQALEKAFNTKLNTMNVKAFNTELSKSGLTMNEVYSSFSRAGATGEAAFRQLATQALNMNLQIKESHIWLDKMATTLANTVKWNVASTAVNTLTRSVQQAWGFVKNLDTSLNDIRIVTGKSSDEMAKFAEQANKAATQLGRTTTDYTKAALIYAQQGLSDKEIQSRSKITLKTANVTGQSASEVSEQLTAVWNGYKVSANEAELYVDRLAAVAATTASNLEELSTGMSKVASAAASLGVGEDQLAAQLSTIISVTKQAPESVGTALRTVYARITDIKAGIDEDGVDLGRYSGKMAQLGFNVLDANGKLRDMGEVIEQIGGKWDYLTREQQISLAQTMAGQRQYSNLIALFDNFEKYNEALNTAQNSAGTLEKQQSIYMDSMKAHLNELTTAIEKIWQGLSDPKAITSLIDGLTTITKLIADVVNGLGGGTDVLRVLGTVAFNAFHTQIANGLQTTINNFSRAKEQAENFKTILSNIKNTNVDNELTKGILQKQNSLIKASKRLSVDEFVKAKEALEGVAQAANKLGKVQQEVKNLQNSFQLGANGIKNFEKIYGNLEKALKDDVGFSQIEKNLNEMKEKLEQISSNNLREITSIFQNFRVELSKGLDPKNQIINLQNSLKTLKQELKSTNIGDSNLFAMLPQSARKAVYEANNALKGLETKNLSNEQLTFQVQAIWDKVSHAISDPLKDINGALQQGQDGFIKWLETQKAASNQYKNSERNFNSLSKSFNNFSKNLTDSIRGLANLYTSMKTFSNLGSIFNDKTLSDGEKFDQIVSNLLTSIPLFAIGIKSLGTALSSAFGPVGWIVTGLTALGTAIAAVFVTRDEAARKLEEQRLQSARENADAADERQQKINEQIDSLIALQKQYENNQITRNDLETSINKLLDTYGLQENHLDKLIEKYGGLKSAIQGATQEKIQQRKVQLANELTDRTVGAAQKIRSTDEIAFTEDSSKVYFEIPLAGLDFFDNLERVSDEEKEEALQALIKAGIEDEGKKIGNFEFKVKLDTNNSTFYPNNGIESEDKNKYKGFSEGEFLKLLSNQATEIGSTQSSYQVDRIIANIFKRAYKKLGDDFFDKLDIDSKSMESLDSTSDWASFISSILQGRNSEDIEALFKNIYEGMGQYQFLKAIYDSNASSIIPQFAYDQNGFSSEQEAVSAIIQKFEIVSNNFDKLFSHDFWKNNITSDNSFSFKDALNSLKSIFSSQEVTKFSQTKEALEQTNMDELVYNALKEIGIKSFKDYYDTRRQIINEYGGEEEEALKLVDSSIKRYNEEYYELYNERAKFLDSLIKNTGIKNNELNNDFLAILENSDENSLRYLRDEILPKYGGNITSLEDFYRLIKNLQDIEVPKATMTLTEATEQYNLYSSLLDQILNSKKQTINKTEFEKLQPDIQQYFRIMADGTYKLIIAAKDFEKIINEKSLSGLDQVGKSLLDREKRIKDFDKNFVLSKLKPDQFQFINKIINSSKQTVEGIYSSLLPKQQQLLRESFTHDDYTALNAIDLIRNQHYGFGLSAEDIYNEYNVKGEKISFLKDSDLMDYLDVAQAMGFSNDNMLSWQTDYAAGKFSDEVKDSIINFLITTFQNVDTKKISEELENQYLSIQLQIASSAKNIQQLDQLKKDYNLSDEAVAAQQIEINKQQDIEDLDTDQLQKYTEYIQQIAKDSDLFADSLARNDQAAQIVAKSIMNMNNGLETLTENWEKWSEILKNNTEDTEEYANTITAMQEAVSNLLDISIDYVSKDFIRDHLDLIEEAANGSQDAIDDLRDSLAGQVMLKIALDHDMLESEKQELINEFSKIQQYAAQINITPGMDESQIVSQMNDLIAKFNLTADQANAVLDTIGYEPTFATQEVELPQSSAETVTHFVADDTQSFQASANIFGLPIASISIPAFKMVTEPNGSVDIPGTKISVPSFKNNGHPTIAKITKKAGGSYSNPSSSGKKSGGSGGKGGGGKGGSGGGSGAKPNTNQKDKKKPLEDERDLYHDINIQISKINRSIDRLQKQQDRLYGKQLLDNLSKQTSLLQQQKGKLLEKQKIQQEDLKNQQEQLKTLGAVFDEYGNIANYMQVLGDKQDHINNLTDKYNALVQLYNASTDSDYKSALEDQMKYYEKSMQQAQEDLNKTKTKIGNYDSLRDAMEDLKDQIDEITQKEIEINIKKFKYELQIRLDMREAAKDWNQFKREVLERPSILKGTEFEKIMADARQNQGDIESYFNVGTGGAGMLETLTKQATDLRKQIEKIDQTGWSDIYGDNKAQAMADLKDDLSQLMGSLEDIHNLIDQIDQAYLDTIDDIQDQWDKQIEDYEFVNQLLQHNIDLVNLLYGDKNYQAMDSYYQQMHNNSLRELESLANRRDLWKKLWDQAVESGESVAAQKFKQNWMNTVNEINNMIKQSIDTLKNQYENTINGIFDKMNRGITNGKGLDYLGFEWDLMNEKAEDYLDTINSAFAIQQTERKYQKALNDTKDIKNQKVLKDLMDEQLTILKNKQKITQYDIDRAEKLLQVEQARIALEDMRSAKTTLRLKRDSQGNYSYEYHADNDAIADAQDALAQAQNELYNFDKAAYQTNLNQIYNLWQEFLQKYKQINLDASLSDEERQMRLDELTEEYGDRINLRLQQNMNIRNNLYDSAFQEYANLYENNLQNFDQMLQGENGMIPMWTSGIQQMADKMTAEGGFLPVTQESLEKVKEETNKWKSEIEETAETAGISLGEISQGIDSVTEDFGELIEANDQLLERFTLEEQAAAELKNYLDELASGYDNVYNEAVNAVGQLYEFVQAQEAAAASYQATASAYVNMINTMQAANAAYNSGQYAAGYSGGGSDGSSSSGGSNGSGSSSGGGSSSSALNSAKQNAIEGVEEAFDYYAFKARQADRLATGGYTGEWGNEQKMAFLHEKELVLNKEDTQNLLNTISLLREMFVSANLSAANRMSDIHSKISRLDSAKEAIQQNVKIDANFPNVNSKREIEQAFSDLVNLAAQRVLR